MSTLWWIDALPQCSAHCDGLIWLPGPVVKPAGPETSYGPGAGPGDQAARKSWEAQFRLNLSPVISSKIADMSSLNGTAPR